MCIVTASTERLLSGERHVQWPGMAVEIITNNGIRTWDNVHQRQAGGLVLGVSVGMRQ